MSLSPALLEILACPEDKGPLFYIESESLLYNPRLMRRYDVRDDIPVDLLARHVLAALETAMRDWAEGRVDDPMEHVRIMLTLSFHGAANRA